MPMKERSGSAKTEYLLLKCKRSFGRNCPGNNGPQNRSMATVKQIISQWLVTNVFINLFTRIRLKEVCYTSIYGLLVKDIEKGTAVVIITGI
jgi:hypothetical protein